LSGCSETEAVVAHVLKLDALRCDAIVANDIDTLEKIIADDFVYTHASGLVDTKETYMATRRSGSVKFTKLAREDIKVRVFHSLVVFLTGRLRSWLSTGQTQKVNYHRFTAVWTKVAEDWRIVSFEATNIVDTKTDIRVGKEAAADSVTQ